jgi:hypothetical protein
VPSPGSRGRVNRRAKRGLRFNVASNVDLAPKRVPPPGGAVRNPNGSLSFPEGPDVYTPHGGYGRQVHPAATSKLIGAYEMIPPQTPGEKEVFYEDSGFNGAGLHSDWPEKVFLAPRINRPPYAEDFFQDALAATAGGTNAFVQVVSYRVQENSEGVLLLMAGDDRVNPGTTMDLVWELRINGETLPNMSNFNGVWSELTSGRPVVVWVKRSQLIELRVSDPGAGAVRSVKATIQGWTAPIRGGGAVASGYVRH